MALRGPRDVKVEALRESGTFNGRAEAVRLSRLLRRPPFAGTNPMDATPTWGAVWPHLVPVGAPTGSGRGYDALAWPLWASRRMTRKRFRANELRGRMRGQLGPLGTAESRPVAATVAPSTPWPRRCRRTQRGPL